MGPHLRVIAALLLLAACAREKKEGAPYALTTARDGEQVRVDVRTADGFHLNEEYPVSFAPEDGGRLPLKDAAKLAACDGHAEEKCALSVGLPNQAGTFAFSVCSKDACLIEKVPIKSP